MKPFLRKIYPDEHRPYLLLAAMAATFVLLGVTLHPVAAFYALLVVTCVWAWVGSWLFPERVKRERRPWD